MEVHPFSQTNLKFEPLSLLLTSTKSLFFTHETAEYILSIKISIRLPRLKTWIYYDFLFYPSPQKRAFPLPVDSLITASEKI